MNKYKNMRKTSENIGRQPTLRNGRKNIISTRNGATRNTATISVQFQDKRYRANISNCYGS